jgi:hypothetical protein
VKEQSMRAELDIWNKFSLICIPQALDYSSSYTCEGAALLQEFILQAESRQALAPSQVQATRPLFSKMGIF